MSNTETTYMKKWLEMNDKMIEKNFNWGALEDSTGEYDQYMSFNLYKMKKEQWDKISIATEKVGHLLNKTYNILLKSPSLLAKLGLPTETWESLTIHNEFFSYFTRLDLVVNNGKIKVIEVNSDTPTGYLETSVANEIICHNEGHQSPNTLEEDIFKAWVAIQKEYAIKENDKVHFTSFANMEEDKQTVLFNMKHSGLKHTEYVPIEEIIVTNDGIYSPAGEKIDFLYRLYPLEFLGNDYDSNGLPIGKMFLDHISSGKVKIINPPSAFLMQSKAVMAIIWSFYEQNRIDLFTEEELLDIKEFFIPTYTENVFLSQNKKYVSKPILGREGGGVKIFDEIGNVIEKDEENWYNEWTNIHQEYVEMPDYTLDTWIGPYTGKLLIGSFLINGKSSGLFLRVGEKITGNLSMFCGITVE